MATATVRLRTDDGRTHVQAAVGTGPVDALYKAIDAVVATPLVLLEFGVRAVTEGIDALGEVSVRIRPEREAASAQREDGRARVFHGHGADTDILVAAAKAYVAAINRMLASEASLRRVREDTQRGQRPRCPGGHMTTPGRTLFDRIWDAHVVSQEPGAPAILYIDLHLVHEVTSPQAFSGLRARGLRVRRPDRTVATMDHSTPTLPRSLAMVDDKARDQLKALEDNCREFGVTLHALGSASQGIVHVIGPELGLTQPGMTIVCGDSHTSTHGAFGALAFGIGTTEVEHVLATQCLLQDKARSMRVRIDGALRRGVGRQGPDPRPHRQDRRRWGDRVRDRVRRRSRARARHGSADDDLQHVDRSGRAGGNDRAGRHDVPVPGPRASTCRRSRRWDAGGRLLAHARHRRRCDVRPRGDDRREHPRADDHVGDQPGDGDRRSRAPSPPPTPRRARTSRPRSSGRSATWRSSRAKPILGRPIDVVFVGSCTNGRISDLRAVARVLEGRRVAPGVRMLVVPGSQRVKKQAEQEGLDRIVLDAGAEWREAGCSMCIAMNGDQLRPGEYAVSTSNRNFEGRQGKGGRTFLASPLTAAASAPSRGASPTRALILESSALTARRAAPRTGASDGQVRGAPMTTASARARSPAARASSSSRDDVDTDQIIPARFLKTTNKSGLGSALFADWRYDSHGVPRPEFALNAPDAVGTHILVAGRNFGCGSSREHAVWALGAWGFRVVVARSFADIFRQNALKNGLLPVAVTPELHAALLARARRARPAVVVTIDLEAQRVSLPDGTSGRVPDRPFAEALPPQGRRRARLPPHVHGSDRSA